MNGCVVWVPCAAVFANIEETTLQYMSQWDQAKGLWAQRLELIKKPTDQPL